MSSIVYIFWLRIQLYQTCHGFIKQCALNPKILFLQPCQNDRTTWNLEKKANIEQGKSINWGKYSATVKQCRLKRTIQIWNSKINDYDVTDTRGLYQPNLLNEKYNVGCQFFTLLVIPGKMGRASRLSKYEKGVIDGLYNVEKSYREISRIINRSHNVVMNYLKNKPE